MNADESASGFHQRSSAKSAAFGKTAPDDVTSIRRHYDLLSPFYHRYWGDHIHHGYWDGARTPAEAQERLVEILAERAKIPHGAHVLDVGCGLGGSSIWLARHRGCRVLGITISPRQARMARRRARAAGPGSSIEFAVIDANQLDLPDASFDAVWVVECSEHLRDKSRFIADCYRLLRPGGRLALCAWLAGANDSDAARQQLIEICESMLCPSLATLRDYVDWMERAGFRDIEAEDISPRVRQTWTECLKIAKRPAVRLFLPVLGSATRRFIRSFAAMQQAYDSGALGYGIFTGSNPGMIPHRSGHTKCCNPPQLLRSAP